MRIFQGVVQKVFEELERRRRAQELWRPKGWNMAQPRSSGGRAHRNWRLSRSAGRA